MPWARRGLWGKGWLGVCLVLHGSLHTGALMAQGLYIAKVPVVCMTPVASGPPVALPYALAHEIQGGGPLPSARQLCQQMGLEAMNTRQADKKPLRVKDD